MSPGVAGAGTPEDPWQLKTPPGSSEYTAWRDASLDPPALVVQVGKTQLRYHLRCIEDLHAMLQEHGDWMPLGSADEQKPAADGTVEAWARSADNPVGASTASRRGCAAASRSTCRPCSRRSASPRSSTSRATTACARSNSSGRRPRVAALEQRRVAGGVEVVLGRAVLHLQPAVAARRQRDAHAPEAVERRPAQAADSSSGRAAR